MEYTASYYQNLTFYLHDNGISVSIINPMVLKRFIQMKLQHNKTDKGDAKIMVQYAKEQKLILWKPKPKYIIECKDLHTTIAIYHKQSTALKNKLPYYVQFYCL